MFHASAIKLAGFYLAILVFISLFFSLNVYQLSVQEFERGIRRPGPSFNLQPGQEFSNQLRDELLSDREQQFRDAKQHIIGRLVLINIVLLAAGGVLSYYLALRTLRPIEEAHAAQSRFTADASHELRTPITAMRSENEVALMNPKLTLAQAKQQLRSNIEELEKLTSLSEGLLRLASLENTALPTVPIKSDTIADKAVSRVLPLAEQKHILIQTIVKTNALTIGDEDSLTEVLVILLDNAIKYSPEQSEIQLIADQENKNLTFQVTDQGLGIKASELPHIFERFYRADTARSKQQTTGYGLGLAIAHNIATLHHGSLTATSTPGQGSTFTLILPASSK